MERERTQGPRRSQPQPAARPAGPAQLELTAERVAVIHAALRAEQARLEEEGAKLEDRLEQLAGLILDIEETAGGSYD